jgi:adenylosuccinate lyase
MESVRPGGNRQELHATLRVHSHDAAAKVKLEGGANDLIDRIAADDSFPLTKEEITQHLDPAKYTGRAPGQVDEFLSDVIAPLLARYPVEEIKAELNV